MTRKLAFGALTLALMLTALVIVAVPAFAAQTVTVNGQTVDIPDSNSSSTTGSQGSTGPTGSTPSGTTPTNGGTTGPTSPNDDSGSDTPKKKKPAKKKSPGKFLKEGKAKDKVEGKAKSKSKDKAAKKKSKKDKAADLQADPLGLGPAPVGVPNFVISRFTIPPFLLPIYQAAGSQYGIRWEVLAAINEIETDYGRNLNVSSAGALGWMQFMPGTWATYGTDANEDGIKDPYNPVDAIFAAARYLKAAGGDTDLRTAIYAYNHADWYVDSVLTRARRIAGLPADLVGSLTGLTQGHFPVYATSRYEGSLTASEARRLGKRTNTSHNAARIVSESGDRRSINIFSRDNAPVIAVNDATVAKLGKSDELGNYIVLDDVYGNRYTYAHLAEVANSYPVPRSDGVKSKDEFDSANNDKQDAADQLPKPDAPASAGRQAKVNKKVSSSSPYTPTNGATGTGDTPAKERLFANPARAANRHIAQQQGQPIDGSDFEEFHVYFSRVLKLSPKEMELKPLKKGSKLVAGTVLGRIGQLESGPGSDLEPHLNFSIRPAGKTAPRIDPKPILDGWKLLEATALYRAQGKDDPFSEAGGGRPSPGQALLMSKELLQQIVLNDPRVHIYPCGRDDVRTGLVDRRVLALLEFLAASGYDPTVSSLSCGHSFYTAAGGVSDHPFGRAVDIAEINGTPIYGNQGPGTITETVLRKMMTLQGEARPYQLISLMSLGGPSFSLADHYDHIHAGFPSEGAAPTKQSRSRARAVLSRNQWDKFVSQLTNIQNPVVPTSPSQYSTKVKKSKRNSRNSDGG